MKKVSLLLAAAFLVACSTEPPKLVQKDEVAIAKLGQDDPSLHSAAIGQIDSGETVQPASVQKTEVEKAVVFFQFNSAVLDSNYSSLDSLQSMAEFLKGNPNVSVQISGWADRIGSKKYNEYLAMNRADQVLKYLLGAGVSPDQVTAGKGGISRTTHCGNKRKHALIVCLKPDRRVEVEKK